MDNYISVVQIMDYRAYLSLEERAQGTIEKYLRDVRTFADFVGDRPVDKALVSSWKESLLARNYAPKTINSMLAAVHGFFSFLGWEGCSVKYLKVQRRLFRDPGRELTKEEYDRLQKTALGQGRHRLALMMETICATGIRVSEVQYIMLAFPSQLCWHSTIR